MAKKIRIKSFDKTVDINIPSAFLHSKNKSDIRTDYTLLLNEEFDYFNESLWGIRKQKILISGSLYNGHGVDIVNNQLRVFPYLNENNVWESSSLIAKFGVYNTLVETKVKIPQTVNVCNAFWATGDQPISLGSSCFVSPIYPLMGELDFVEQETWDRSFNTVSGTVHSCINPLEKTLKSEGIYFNKEIDTDYHIYGFYYGDEGLRIYIDRELVVSKDLSTFQKWNPLEFKFPMYMIFSSQVTNTDLNVADPPENDNPMIVDWVRVYKVKDDPDFVIGTQDGTEITSSLESLILENTIPTVNVTIGEQNILFIKSGNITMPIKTNYTNGITSGNVFIPSTTGSPLVTLESGTKIFSVILNGVEPIKKE